MELSILAAGVGLRRRGVDEFHGYAIARGSCGKWETRGGSRRTGRFIGRWSGRTVWAADESASRSRNWREADRRPRRRLYTITALGVQVSEAAAAELPPAPAPGTLRRSPRGGAAS